MWSHGSVLKARVYQRNVNYRYYTLLKPGMRPLQGQVLGCWGPSVASLCIRLEKVPMKCYFLLQYQSDTTHFPSPFLSHGRIQDPGKTTYILAEEVITFRTVASGSTMGIENIAVLQLQ